MQIPTISTLRTEDFPSEQKWISRLLQPINQFLTSATTALNGNITFTDNIPCQLITLNFIYSASTDFPKYVKWSIAQNNNNSVLLPPVELRLCSATENGTAIAVAVTWSYANGLITISSIVKISSSGISGLTAGATYNIILRGQP